MKPKCIIDGCDKAKKYGNGKCGMHWTRAYREGEAQTIIRQHGTGSIGSQGYIVLTKRYRRVGVHVDVAEKAIGKRLPKGAIVHHVNEDRGDNSNSNLVVCPSNSYHHLLHQRMRALDACGNASWRKCWVCKQYDDPAALYVNGMVGHKDCIKRHAAEYYKKRTGAPT